MILLPLLSIFGFASIFASFFKTRFTFSLPIVTSLLVATLFSCSIFGTLQSSTLVIIVSGILCLIYSLCASSEFREKILSYKIELIVLTLITIAYAVFLRTKYIYIWDDLAFWTIFTKELMFYHEIYPDATLSSILPTHIHYPRGPSLFHYFMLYLPGDSEQGVLISHFFLQMLFLAPIMANKYFWQTILLVSLMLYFPVMESFVLRSIYNDGMIGFVFSSVLVTFILEKGKNKALWLVIPTIAIMPLFREIGLLLAWSASLVIFCILLIEQNLKINTSRKIFILLISMALPFATYHIWFDYVESHVVMGRNHHSIDQVSSIITSLFDLHGKSLKISWLYTKVLGNAFLSPSFLFIYAVLIFASYGVYKYGLEHRKSFRRVLLASFICFIIFLMWRLYIYILLADEIYTTLDQSMINLGCVIRYSTSYVVAFCAIGCAYIRLTLFDSKTYSLIVEFDFVIQKIKQSFIALWQVFEKYLVFVVLILTITTVYLIVGQLLLMPKLKLSNPELSFRIHANYIYDLMSKGFKVDYDFSFDEAINVSEKTFVCFKLAYFLTPYYNNDLRKQCLAEKLLKKNYISSIELNKTSSNVPIDDVLQNPERYKCNIKYYPMYNHIDIKCSDR